MRFYFRDFQCHIFCRGNSEKLYVTKDNRETQQNNCRSVCCIVVAVLFVSSAVAVATLIGGKEVLKNFFLCEKMYNSIFHDLKWESSIQCKETLKVTRTAGPEISFPRRSEANPSLKKLYQKKPQTLTGSPKRPLKMSWRNLFPPGQVSKKERKGKHKKIQSVWNSFHNEKKIRF